MRVCEESERKSSYVEFQAIILAGGGGSRLYPLSENRPKSLVEVANRPLLAFQLQLLEQAGFSEVIVITIQSQATLISRYCNEVYDGRIGIQIAVVDDQIGTADAIRSIKDRIKTDFLVISGDLITDVQIHYLADIHRTQDATLTSLLWKDDSEHAHKPKRDTNFKHYIALDNVAQQRMLCYRAVDDVEDETLNVPKSLLLRYPDLTIYSTLRDAHCYIFSHWIIRLLDELSDISSLQAELIPFLTEHQFSGDQSILRFSSPNPQALALSMADFPRREPGLLRERSKSTDKDSIKCFAFIAPADRFCRRAVTANDFQELNRFVVNRVFHDPNSQWSESILDSNHLQSLKAEYPQAQFGPNCIIGASVKVGEQTSLKRCVVGKHCRIGNRVRAVDSVFMEHVVIEDDCVIKDSVICDGASISQDCLLESVIVAGHLTVAANTHIFSSNY
uniref:Translation initiation factor eIF2B subunit gamma n=1 Tax=Hirondellea gigas TaxID=1518452 RepID=A0A6A7G5I2_9CRUS